MRLLVGTIVTAGVALAVSCSSTAPSPAVPFTRIASFPAVGSASVVSAGQQVIRDADTWAQVWSNLTNQLTPAPPLPAVDFTTSVVLFTTMGQQPSSGYQTSISAVTSGSVEQLIVGITQTTPGSTCAVLAMMTTPADAVTVSRDLASFVQFKITQSVRQCGS